MKNRMISCLGTAGFCCCTAHIIVIVLKIMTPLQEDPKQLRTALRLKDCFKDCFKDCLKDSLVLAGSTSWVDELGRRQVTDFGAEQPPTGWVDDK